MFQAKFGITLLDRREDDNGKGEDRLNNPHIFAVRRSLLKTGILGRRIISADIGDEYLELNGRKSFLELSEMLGVNNRVKFLLGATFSGKKDEENLEITLKKQISFHISDILPYVKCTCIEYATVKHFAVDYSQKHLVREGICIEMCSCGGSFLRSTQQLSDEAIRNVIGG